MRPGHSPTRLGGASLPTMGVATPTDCVQCQSRVTTWSLRSASNRLLSGSLETLSGWSMDREGPRFTSKPTGINIDVIFEAIVLT